MDDINSLRREVERMRRAATRKVSRIKTRHGVNVTGTEFDPRRGTQLHERYTAAQLTAYKARLESFLSRQNQYVPDASARPIPRAEWQGYKAREDAYRQVAGTVYENLKNVELPSGETVAERLSKMNVVHKQMHNPVTNLFFDPHERMSQDVVSREALKKLKKDLDRKARPETLRAKVREAKEQFAKMAEVINEPDFRKAVTGLSDKQFVALWNYTNFASAIVMAYESAKKMLSPKEESWGHEKVRQQTNDAMSLVEWAKSQPL